MELRHQRRGGWYYCHSRGTGADCPLRRKPLPEKPPRRPKLVRGSPELTLAVRIVRHMAAAALRGDEAALEWVVEHPLPRITLTMLGIDPDQALERLVAKAKGNGRCKVASVNKVILVGRLGKPPEVKMLESGQVVTRFSVATDRSWTDAEGERQEATDWHRVETWGRLAEVCGEYLDTGRLVYVEGRLQTDVRGEGDDRRYYPKIVASSVQFLDRPS